MRPEKKQLEHLIIRYFREYCKSFPKGKVVASESPDFILKIKSRLNLGIELTRLNPQNAKTLSSKELNRDKFRDEIIVRAKNIFNQSSSENLFVKFLFSDKIEIKPESALVVSARLTNLVRNALQNKNTNSFFRESITGSSLPGGIDEILIIHESGFKTSVWERSNNLGVSENIIEDIRQTIINKDKKLKFYQKKKLTNYWLIINIDRLRGTKNYQLRNTIENVSFQSDFEHVFLFDLMRAECHQLV